MEYSTKMQPTHPKIYHIVHIDKLQSIIDGGYLFSDAEVIKQGLSGTVIGMSSIKKRRLEELTLDSHPILHVGECVPFYFCPRSVMLYMIYKHNSPDITYRDGQDDIVHLEIDLHKAIGWAEENDKSWAFTFSNAGSYYFEDSNDLSRLNELDWRVINSNQWSGAQDKKQSEFLCEHSFPWELVEHIGVCSETVSHQVKGIINNSGHKPEISIKRNWYY